MASVLIQLTLEARKGLAKDDFRNTVVPCRHDCGVMFLLESGGAKISQTNVRGM
jgi:hypothetical protein